MTYRNARYVAGVAYGPYVERTNLRKRLRQSGEMRHWRYGTITIPPACIYFREVPHPSVGGVPPSAFLSGRQQATLFIADMPNSYVMTS